MELIEFKNLWKEECQQLEERVRLNEKFIQEMNLDKVVSEFDKLLKLSLLGRNLALVYGFISFALVFLTFKEWEYSIPCLIGGFAMLWSFSYNSKIQKLDYYHLSVVDLQKSICDFRIHTAKTAKSDSNIVFLWILTIVPIFCKFILKTHIYTDSNSFAYFIIAISIFSSLFFPACQRLYKDYDTKLIAAETSLNEIVEFEKV
jgi:hypothetical protein